MVKAFKKAMIDYPQLSFDFTQYRAEVLQYFSRRAFLKETFDNVSRFSNVNPEDTVNTNEIIYDTEDSQEIKFIGYRKPEAIERAEREFLLNVPITVDKPGDQPSLSVRKNQKKPI